MSKLCVALAFVFSVGLVSCGEPVVNCPAPRSPQHGQSFLYQEGRVVKFVCESGFEIRGRHTARCLDGSWEEPEPICVPIGDTDDSEDFQLPPEMPEESPNLIPPPQRPLFNWGGDDDVDDVLDDDVEIDDDDNSTSAGDDTPMADQARVRTVVYPNRILLRNALLRRAALRSRVIEIEEADRKHRESSSSRAVRLQGPPSVLYLRRRGESGKPADGTAGQQIRTAAVEQEGEQPQGDKGGDAQRQYYWWAAQHYYQHPQQSAALADYASVHPYGLTESQMAWINSLHPETRDQYLRDIYGLRTDYSAEAQRAQAFLGRYGDYYNYYHHPYYYREPLALLTQDVVSQYDYSCNQAGSPFVRAPKLRHAHIAKYDRRQNPNSPNNHYLAVVYRCNPGYVMYDTRYTDLFCSKGAWIGNDPVCVRART